MRSLVGHKWAFDRSLHGLFNLKGSWLQRQFRKSSPIIDDHLPYVPFLPGFAINTMFYSAILWLLFALPFVLRRRLRAKRGLCVKCAYDLRGRAMSSDVCPECGTATLVGVKPRKGAGM